jgi:CelD/BcsL family acetyltransferase involved in cellulose biosynthesis
MIDFEIIRNDKAIEKYFPLWDETFDSSVYEPSVSVEWTRALLNTHVEYNSFMLIVLRKAREICGIVPLVIVKAKKLGFSYLTAMPISEYYNTHSDLLLLQSKEEGAGILLKALNSLNENWDIFRIQRFVETNPCLNILERSLKKTPMLKFEIYPETPSYYIQLGHSYEAYLNNRTKNFRSNLKRHEKKVNSMGRVSYYGIQEGDNISDLYQKILYIEENSWKHKRGTAITSILKQKEFYKQFCESSFKKKWLCLRFLSINDEPIAYEMGVIKQNKYYSLKASYHEKYKKTGSATVLFAWLIRDLIQSGIEEYDFTSEPYDYERQWTDKLRAHKSLIVYNNSYKARLVYLYNSMKRKRVTKKAYIPIPSPGAQNV